MPTCKWFSFDDIARANQQPGIEGKVATHHMKLYDLARAKAAPVILEFGVDKGRTTCLFATACEQNGGHLYSVDIVDCSDTATSPAWTFIQASALDQAAILAAAPEIAGGIDLLHIDSLHDEDHVSRLLALWYPLVKQDGAITLHDVDPTPYTAGQRKDNAVGELNVEGVARAARRFFYANEDDLFLEFHFGSTGMAIMRKLSPLGTPPKPPAILRSRHLNVSGSALAWTARYAAQSVVQSLKRRLGR